MISKLPADIQHVLNEVEKIEVTKVCEKGGCGYVVLGKDLLLNREVAIKFISEEEHKITEEPKKLCEIDHKNILKVYAAKKFADDSLYFVTPIAKHGDLDDYMKSDSISLKQALSITHGILNGLNQLHTPPDCYLHRDLKPSNIFMNNGIPMIGDFGSIKKLDDVSESVNASRMTLFYKTPETIKENKHYIQSDIYQVGVILHQLLGGSIDMTPRNYLNKREMAKFNKMKDEIDKTIFVDDVVKKCIEKGRLLNYDNLPSYVPTSLIKILKAATNKNYKKRYKEVTQFMCEIARVCGGIPNWKQSKNEITLEMWNKKSFKIIKEKSSYIAMRKISGSSKWRNEKHSKSANIEGVVQYLQNAYNIPK